MTKTINTEEFFQTEYSSFAAYDLIRKIGHIAFAAAADQQLPARPVLPVQQHDVNSGLRKPEVEPKPPGSGSDDYNLTPVFKSRHA